MERCLNVALAIKKESPNEGTETAFVASLICSHVISIKKESPNEGTETRTFQDGVERIVTYKKRIPE